jgi:plasmid stabilization system protein ParE
MLTVILTNRASLSFDEIIDYYIDNHSSKRAEKVLHSIDEAFDRIAKSPNSFPVCFDIDKPQENIRQAIVHNTFKIIFRVQVSTVEIIEIFHSSRSPEKLKNIG